MANGRRSRKRNYELNPFFDDQEDLISDIEGLLAAYDDETMSDRVRNLNVRGGLDNAARRYTGDHSGVYGADFDDMVRSDGPYMGATSEPPTAYSYGDEYFGDVPDSEKKDWKYLRYADPNYYRNEYNQHDDYYNDLDDIDADADFFYSLAHPDEDDPFDQGIDDDFDNTLDYDFDDEDSEDEMDDEDLDIEDGDASEYDPLEMEDFDPDLNSLDEPIYDGIVRAIKGAYLVSRKEQPDETFTEVWIYNVDNKYETEANIRKAIISGTDIDPKSNVSEDKSQEAIYTTVGNVQFLTITGLPS